MPTTNTSNYTTLYSTTAGAVAPQQPYGNANVEAFLNVGTDGGNTVQNIVANGTITANGNIEANGFFVGDGGFLSNITAYSNIIANVANQVVISNSNATTNFNYYPVFANSAGQPRTLDIDDSGNTFTYNPQLGRLTVNVLQTSFVQNGGGENIDLDGTNNSIRMSVSGAANSVVLSNSSSNFTLPVIIGNSAANTVTFTTNPVGANLVTLDGNYLVNQVRESFSTDLSNAFFSDDAVVLPYDTANGLTQEYRTNYFVRDSANTSNVAIMGTQEFYPFSYNAGDKAAAGYYQLTMFNTGSDLANADINTATAYNIGTPGLGFTVAAPTQYPAGTPIMGVTSYGRAANPQESVGLRFTRRRGNGSARLSLEPNDYLGNIEWRGSQAGGAAPAGNRFPKIAPRVDSSYVANTAAVPAGIDFIVVNNTASITHNFYSNGNVNFSNNVNATSFSGDGGNLSNITSSVSNVQTAANFTGRLAIVNGSGNSPIYRMANVIVTESSGNVVLQMGTSFMTDTGFTGNGAGLTNVTAVSSNFANFAGNVTNSAQPNITSVGTLVGLNMGGNITANANVTYDIGNSTNRFKDIWLANSTIYLGDANLKSDDSNSTFNVSVTGRANALVVGNTSANVNTGNLRVGNILISDNNNLGFTATLNTISVPNNNPVANNRSIVLLGGQIDSLANITDATVTTGGLILNSGSIGNNTVRISSTTQNLSSGQAQLAAGTVFGDNNAGRNVNGGIAILRAGSVVSNVANNANTGQITISAGAATLINANTVNGGQLNSSGAAIAIDSSAANFNIGNVNLGITNHQFSTMSLNRSNGIVGNIRFPLVNFGAAFGTGISIGNGVSNITVNNVTTTDQVYFRTGGVAGLGGVTAGNINNVLFGNVTTQQLRLETGSWVWPTGPNVSNVTVGNLTTGDILFFTGATSNATSVTGTLNRGNIRLNAKNVLIETSNTSNSSFTTFSFGPDGTAQLANSVIVTYSNNATDRVLFTTNVSNIATGKMWNSEVDNPQTEFGITDLRFSRYTNFAGMNNWQVYRTRGTSASRLPVQTGDTLYSQTFDAYGDSGNVFVNGGSIRLSVKNNDGAGNLDTNFTIGGGSTTTSNSNIAFTNFSIANFSSANVSAGSFSTANTNIYANGSINTTGTLSYLRTYASFYNSNDIAITANTVANLDLPSTYSANGVSIVSSNQITIARAGTYNIQMSLQLLNTDNASEHEFDVWFAKNGTDIADSATQYTVIKNNGKNVVALNFVDTAAANDYYQIRYAASSANISLEAFPSQASPYVRPAVPSAIVTVVPVGA